MIIFQLQTCKTSYCSIYWCRLKRDLPKNHVRGSPYDTGCGCEIPLNTKESETLRRSLLGRIHDATLYQTGKRRCALCCNTLALWLPPLFYYKMLLTYDNFSLSYNTPAVLSGFISRAPPSPTSSPYFGKTTTQNGDNESHHSLSYPKS